jgi:hypothetical protein
MVDGDNVVHSCKTARTVLTSVIVTAPDELREQLRDLTRERRARVCAALATRQAATAGSAFCTDAHPAWPADHRAPAGRGGTDVATTPATGRPGHTDTQARFWQHGKREVVA